jgi:hypothetical protein
LVPSQKCWVSGVGLGRARFGSDIIISPYVRFFCFGDGMTLLSSICFVARPGNELPHPGRSSASHWKQGTCDRIAPTRGDPLRACDLGLSNAGAGPIMVMPLQRIEGFSLPGKLKRLSVSGSRAIPTKTTERAHTSGGSIRRAGTDNTLTDPRQVFYFSLCVHRACTASDTRLFSMENLYSHFLGCKAMNLKSARSESMPRATSAQASALPSANQADPLRRVAKSAIAGQGHTTKGSSS